MEVAMNDTFASLPYPVVWPGTPVEPVKASHWRNGLGALRGIIETWEERIRFRWDLAQMLNSNPHLIDDIGLTRRQAEAEIAKPFWRG
jgi:uncharacterized protein YjiS (DUF1127 family)